MNEQHKEGDLKEVELDCASDLRAAKQRISQLGDSRWLILAGFMIAIFGVAFYCYLTLFTNGGNTNLVFTSLAVMGGGVMVWLVGAIRYFNLAIDCGDSDTIF
jgi:hypothetical protein